jgi:hypothetical protein
VDGDLEPRREQRDLLRFGRNPGDRRISQNDVEQHQAACDGSRTHLQAIPIVRMTDGLIQRPRVQVTDVPAVKPIGRPARQLPSNQPLEESLHVLSCLRLCEGRVVPAQAIATV